MRRQVRPAAVESPAHRRLFVDRSQGRKGFLDDEHLDSQRSALRREVDKVGAASIAAAPLRLLAADRIDQDVAHRAGEDREETPPIAGVVRVAREELGARFVDQRRPVDAALRAAAHSVPRTSTKLVVDGAKERVPCVGVAAALEPEQARGVPIRSGSASSALRGSPSDARSAAALAATFACSRAGSAPGDSLGGFLDRLIVGSDAIARALRGIARPPEA